MRKVLAYNEFINETLWGNSLRRSNTDEIRKEDSVTEDMVREYIDKRYTYGIKSITIKNNIINIDGDFYFKKNSCENGKLPFMFGIVTGDFFCDHNNLTTLDGCPKEVSGDFMCSNNKLTSLEGGPKEVGGSFYCGYNKLTSLEGAPEKVTATFGCQYNRLTSLRCCPKEIGDSFYCFGNKLTSLDGCPKELHVNFYCFDNKLTSLDGGPKNVGGEFNCSYNKKIFTEEEVRQVCDVKGNIHV